MNHLTCLGVVVGLALTAAGVGPVAATTLTTLHVFHDTDGNAPDAALVLATNGNFYGTTQFGGMTTNDCVGSCGTLFEISPSGAFTELRLFSGTDGSALRAGLVQGSDGNLYGTTADGGGGLQGTVFRLTLSGVLTDIHGESQGDPGGSAAGLVEASDGNFYGTTYASVFQITTDGVWTTVSGGLLGAAAALIQGRDGSLYGTTQFGGTSTNCGSGCGTVFQVTLEGVLTILHSFDGSDGREPVAALVQGSDGALYGTTSGGLLTPNCSAGCGTVFRITTNGEFTTLYAFSGTDGRQPRAGLVQGSDGNLYGTTFYGGASLLGTVFQITTNGVLTRLISFNAINGGDPAAGLVQDSTGAFYGTTQSGGGTNGFGTVFKLTVTGSTNVSTDADLALTKTASAASVAVNSNLTYTLVVTNLGATALAQVTITDPLPATVAFVSAAAGCTNVGGTVTCDCGTLTAHAAATKTIVVAPLVAGTLTNTATVASATNDPVPANNTAQRITTVTAGGGGGGGNTLTPTLTLTAPKCKTKNGVTTCKLSGLLALLNTATTAASPVHVRFFLSANTTYDAGVDSPAGEATSKLIKAGKTGKLKLKATVNANPAGLNLLAVDDSGTVLTSLPVP